MDTTSPLGRSIEPIKKILPKFVTTFSVLQTMDAYIKKIDRQYQTGIAREHSYRPALSELLDRILPNWLIATNEPARIACGAPDFIISEKTSGLPIAFIEAKDLFDSDLTGSKEHKEQFTRYKESLERIIFTDYLTFRLYIGGEEVKVVTVGRLEKGRIEPLKENFGKFEELISVLIAGSPQPITTPATLAKLMAAKARLLAEVINRAMTSQEPYQGNRVLYNHYEDFRNVLINDLTKEEFADFYAQTIVYGIFAAKLHDDNPDTFSRMRVGQLLPRSNPLLRQLFQAIATFDLDERIGWIVDDLVEGFRHADIHQIMGQGNQAKQHDPMIHFYEDFLASYNPKLRKAKGVWYTPQPVVSFIVRAVDDLLKQEFGLSQGLADSAKVMQKAKDGKTGEKSMREMHRVQILDPATGTGTFLAEVVRKIYSQQSQNLGMWSGYVTNHLLPRLNGFELMMASYAIAHIKLDMVLGQTGYQPPKDHRLNIFLTNSLEEGHPNTTSLLSDWLTDEANAANDVKRNTPVMVMLGNPPYSGESANKGKWIMRLLKDYKLEPGKPMPLNERNPKWINDDYVKFIRLAHYYIARNREGIIAFINPHGFLDNPTFRGMRWQLLVTFDKIYTIDLHGNSRKKETAPDGSKDENVFDIMQGVSINIFVKTGKKDAKTLAKVFHHDLWGLRQQKYDALEKGTLKNIRWNRVAVKAPMYFFVPKDFELTEEYEQGFAIQELLVANSVGIVSTKDAFLINKSEEVLRGRVNDLVTLPDEMLRSRYKLKDSRDWKLAVAREDVKQNLNAEIVKKISYRPFDNQYIIYTGSTNGIVARPRFHLFSHFLKKNICLCLMKVSYNDYASVFISNKLTDFHYLGHATYALPLYLYNDFTQERTPNFNPDILAKIAKGLGVEPNGIVPEELFDYIYGVLHSKSYRKRYNEFLKIDFPRIPYPTKESYSAMGKRGNKLRTLHLMENAESWTLTVTYPVAGENLVEKVSYGKNRVWINDLQYFDNVPREAWELYIGGYQPAQKWLKDRRNQTLAYDDILHYQRIIYVLYHTHQLIEKS